MTEASRVQKLLIEQNAEIDQLKNRIEKLEAALREIIEVDPLRPAFNCQSIARKALEP